jgi:hypothetical protein
MQAKRDFLRVVLMEPLRYSHPPPPPFLVADYNYLLAGYSYLARLINLPQFGHPIKYLNSFHIYSYRFGISMVIVITCW